MSRELIAEKLKEAMGLHTPTVGMVTVSSAIDRRMRARGMDNYGQYFQYISSEKQEMKELIEEVIIPETWFFREHQPYNYVLEYFRKNTQTKTLNILSIPCSTGEEPYSIAMMLLDNGLSSSQFRIDAIDIAKKNIEKAQLGKYRKNSFRSDDLAFMNKYFQENDGKYDISENLKNEVNFHCGNILSDSPPTILSSYDVIFCRNLLIYFDENTQNEAFATLERLLKPEGILILGHAETAQHSNGVFIPAIDSNSYVHVKKDNLNNSLLEKKKNTPNVKREKKNQQRQTEIKSQPFADNRDDNKPKKKPEVTVPENQLELAFELANTGDLDQALQACTEHLNIDSNSSQAHYLAGVIHDTNGNTNKANDHLRKAIYIDPNNLEALIHLSLIAEKDGNDSEAIRLRNRAQRVQERQAK